MNTSTIQHEQREILAAIRQLIAYCKGTLQRGCGYAGSEQLVHLTEPQAQIALRYGVPIGIRDKHCTSMGSPDGKMYRYITITDSDNLKRWLAISSMEPLASIHADFPRHIQQRMREYILQIMEIECPDQLPPHKPIAPMLGARGDVYNLLCITNRTLRHAGQQEQAEEMWRRVLDSGDYYKAVSIMGEYVEFDEASGPVPRLGWLGGVPHG